MYKIKVGHEYQPDCCRNDRAKETEVLQLTSNSYQPKHVMNLVIVIN
jgi:hypothetical protein